MATLADYLGRLGLESARLTSREARKVEPLLAPTIRGGLLVPGDASCDNRQLLAALAAAGERAGVRDGHRLRAPRLQRRRPGHRGGAGGRFDDHRPHRGAGQRCLGRSGHRHPPVPVRPVKGQILRLDPGRFPQPGVVVRAFTRGTEIYLVPRDGGREIVVGATTEELGFDRRVTAGGVYELLRDARLAIPMSAEYVLAETSVGYRPGTPDNAPILGRGASTGWCWPPVTTATACC